MFEPNSKESFPEREERVLEFWQKKKIFEKSVDQRRECKVFSFYDGPPFATGLPHYGHLLAGTLKDVVPRYKAMQGYYVPRRFGWDCHGLPVENEIEKAKELSGAAAIEEFGVAKFNEECRGIVLRYTSEWQRTVNRMGRWVSFENTYHTMDLSFMESVWWAFGQLYEKGLVYEGFKVMPFSAKLGTPLSNFEANLNYKDVDDPSLTVTFPLVDEPDTSLLVWTTTPWTLPSNLAIMAKKELEYAKVKDLKTGHHYILAKACLAHYFKNPEEFQVVSTFMGDKLDKRRYEPILPYFANRAQANAFRVILEDSIAAEEGTGLVHSAPAFGEVDFFACAREGIELVCPVDHNGKFTAEVTDFAGMYVKDADKEIIKRLKGDKRVFHHGQVRHRYPFCWRSDTPLIYKAVRTWFVAVEKIKDKMLAANQKIHWVPDHIKEGRFGKWLENARDWAISRNRYWGTPIPIWRSEDGDIIVISSIKDLERRIGKPVTDLHRHFIDQLTFVENGREYRRVPEVFDCWFESGSMPYAQDHYPFERKEQFEKAFPADFIAEGLDQTRGWFYTLTVLAAALFDQPAFKNVIVNGIILAEDGNKMSKRLKNYPEPDAVINRYGADAIRLYLLNSPAVYAEDLRFSEKGVELVLRQVLIPFWNSFVFLSTYAKIYQWHPTTDKFPEPQAEIDQWILSQLQKLTQDVTEQMDRYQLAQVTGPIVLFVEQLTNWYIRRNRARFWSEEATKDRNEAFETLYTVLLTLTKITAPLIPFLSEEIYQQLKMAHHPESVHLSDFPKYQANLRQEKLEGEMASVQNIVSLGHSLRKEHKLKVRQPLAQAHIITANPEVYDALMRQKHLIADELNVKDVVLQQDESAFVQLIAKPNFRILGKKVGKLMNAAQKEISGFSQAQLNVLLQGKNLPIQVEGQEVVLTSEDVSVERKVREGLIAATAQEMTVALDTELNDQLLLEGLAREIVNKINTMRRDEGFAVTDRIAIEISTTDRVKQAFEQHKDYIMHEVLGTQVIFECSNGTQWDLNGEPTTIGIALSVVNSP
ncbi:MAG: isoleucine--tRNA ligase [Verrucomicrobia bacterium]|nr:isoleucine--tRNA ligase [Verrucomicrobiota bacterium]